MIDWILKKLDVHKIIKGIVYEEVKETTLKFVKSAIVEEENNTFSNRHTNSYIRRMIKDAHYEVSVSLIKNSLERHIDELNSEEFLDKVIARIKNKQLN